MQEKEARMKIQATGRRTVSIRLSGEELSGYGLTFAELEPGNRRMEQMMGELLSRVYEETGMDLFDHTLRMKAMPMETGCELTLSGLMARRGQLQNAGPAAVDFLEWKSLCRGAEALLSQGAFRKSSVFQMRNGWRLLLWGEDGNQAVPHLPGGRYAGRGVLFQAAAVEFGEALRRGDALEWLAEGQLRREEIAEAGSGAPNT